MAAKTIETRYVIKEISEDGLLKTPRIIHYHGDRNRFDDYYSNPEDADTAIVEEGVEYTDYVVLTVKRVA